MPMLKIDNMTYDVRPQFAMVCELEEELGPLVELAERFMRDEWKISELVTLTHVALSHIGRNIDYMELGNKMMATGFNNYLEFATVFLRTIIYK